MIEFEMPQEIQKSDWRTKYEAVLQSDRWRNFVRPAILNRAGGVCERCNGTGPLEIHHVTYERLGCEKAQDLLALCEHCHEIADRYREITNFGLWLQDGKRRRLFADCPVCVPDPFNVETFVRAVEVFRSIGLNDDGFSIMSESGGFRFRKENLASEHVPAVIREHFDEILAHLKSREQQ